MNTRTDKKRQLPAMAPGDDAMYFDLFEQELDGFFIPFMASVPLHGTGGNSLAIFSHFAEEPDSRAQKTGSSLERVHFFRPHFGVR